MARLERLSCETRLLPVQLPPPEQWQDPELPQEMAAWNEPTSGSSGTPKLVQVSREVLGHYLALQTDYIRAFLGQSCPAYLVPSHFVEHDIFPRTDTGKVLRRALPNPLERAAKRINGDAAFKAATPYEQEIRSVWIDILGHDQFTPEDDFFDLGGDSLQAMSMVLRIEHRLCKRVGYESLVLKGASIARIAARISDDQQRQNQALLTLKKGGGSPAIYVLPVENGEFSDWLFVLKELKTSAPVFGVHVRDPAQRKHFSRIGTVPLATKAAETIMRHNPEGPYVIAGYSSGTQLAIETARIIQAAGKTIAGLLLLDPPVPRFEPYYQNWRIRRVFSPLMKRRDISLTLNRFGHVFLGLPAREMDVADETRFWTYKPAPFSTPRLHVVFATEENPDLAQKQQYWRDIFGVGFRQTMMPANHQYIMRQRNAQSLALIIDDWLEELR